MTQIINSCLTVQWFPSLSGCTHTCGLKFNSVITLVFSHPRHLSVLLSFSMWVESHPPILLPEVMVSHPKRKPWHIPAHTVGAASNPLDTLSGLAESPNIIPARWGIREDITRLQSVLSMVGNSKFPCANLQLMHLMLRHFQPPTTHPLSERKPAIVPQSGMEHKMYLIILLHHKPYKHTSEFPFKSYISYTQTKNAR